LLVFSFLVPFPIHLTERHTETCSPSGMAGCSSNRGVRRPSFDCCRVFWSVDPCLADPRVHFERLQSSELPACSRPLHMCELVMTLRPFPSGDMPKCAPPLFFYDFKSLFVRLLRGSFLPSPLSPVLPLISLSLFLRDGTIKPLLTQSPPLFFPSPPRRGASFQLDIPFAVSSLYSPFSRAYRFYHDLPCLVSPKFASLHASLPPLLSPLSTLFLGLTPLHLSPVSANPRLPPTLCALPLVVKLGACRARDFFVRRPPRSAPPEDRMSSGLPCFLAAQTSNSFHYSAPSSGCTSFPFFYPLPLFPQTDCCAFDTGRTAQRDDFPASFNPGQVSLHFCPFLRLPPSPRPVTHCDFPVLRNLFRL